jgi:hypothetical protein
MSVGSYPPGGLLIFNDRWWDQEGAPGTKRKLMDLGEWAPSVASSTVGEWAPSVASAASVDSVYCTR